MELAGSAAKSARIEWDHSGRRFIVNLSIESENGSVNFGPTGHLHSIRWPAGEFPVSELPRQIALSSMCVCGDTLALADHTLTRTNGVVDLEAVFACRGCHDAMSSKVGRFFGAIWRKTRKLEAGVSGLKYEKEG